MEPRAIHDLLAERFGAAVTGFEEHKPPFVVVAAASIAEVARFLHDEPDLRFDALMALSGVDYGDKLAVAYHLHSLTHRHVVGLKVYLAPKALELPSVDKVWPCANWHEREAYDLFGITFKGSSDLRRILLPEDWPGHPLRKDYVYPSSYHGVKV